MVTVVRMYPIVVKQGVFRKRKPALEVLDPPGAVELFTCARGSAGTCDIRPTSREALANLGALAPDTCVVSVRPHLPFFSLSFPQVVQDESGYEWDLVAEGTAAVRDSLQFLRSCALGITTPDVPLSQELLESWIVHRMGSKVQDEIRRAVQEHGAWEAVRREAVLPVSWWERQLALWLADYGITPALATVRWESVQLARARAARIRIEQLTILAQEQEATLKAEQHQRQLLAQHEQERLALETDNRLSQMQREHGLALLEKEHRRELIDTETEVENARWAATKAAKEHEIARAGLDHDLEALRQERQGREQAQQIHARILETLDRAREILKKLEALDLFPSLAQESQRHRNVERLLSPEFGFTPEEMTIVGYGSAEGTLLGLIREKARQDHDLATLRKKDLQTRSIPSIRFTRGLTQDISTVQIQHLPINSALQFEFATQRAGLVTLLNVGTSGAIYAHVPNAFVGARAAKAEVNRVYQVPGPEFLPRDGIECYREDGPGGWEHIALIVSDDPVLEHGAVLRSTPRKPLVRLSPEEVEKLSAKLGTFSPQAWTGAVLSFHVAE